MTVNKNRLTMIYRFYSHHWEIINIQEPFKVLECFGKELFMDKKKEVDTYNELQEYYDYRPMCRTCAYDDEGFCACFDRKSVCCPYAKDEEE